MIYNLQKLARDSASKRPNILLKVQLNTTVFFGFILKRRNIFPDAFYYSQSDDSLSVHKDPLTFNEDGSPAISDEGSIVKDCASYSQATFPIGCSSKVQRHYRNLISDAIFASVKQYPLLP